MSVFTVEMLYAVAHFIMWEKVLKIIFKRRLALDRRILKADAPEGPLKGLLLRGRVRLVETSWVGN
jgi:hypothetical protein